MKILSIALSLILLACPSWASDLEIEDEDSANAAVETEQPKTVEEHLEVMRIDVLRKNENCGFYNWYCGDEVPLTTLPVELNRFTSLTCLEIGYCAFDEIPSIITELQTLESLILPGCGLRTLPYQLSGLTKLQELSLYRNCFINFPDVICHMTQLTTLNLRRNKLEALPVSFTLLVNLTDLDIRKNLLTVLPGSFNTLPLTDLDLSNNPFIDEVWESQLPMTLTRLTAMKLKLTSIPISYTNLTHLRYLRLDNNQIASVPPTIIRLKELMEMSINYNKLSYFPKELAGVTNLRQLWFYGNNIQRMNPNTLRILKSGQYKTPRELPNYTDNSLDNEEARITTAVLVMLEHRKCELFDRQQTWYY